MFCRVRRRLNREPDSLVEFHRRKARIDSKPGDCTLTRYFFEFLHELCANAVSLQIRVDKNRVIQFRSSDAVPMIRLPSSASSMHRRRLSSSTAVAVCLAIIDSIRTAP